MRLRTALQTTIGLSLASVALAGATMTYSHAIDAQIRVIEGVAYVRTVERGLIPVSSRLAPAIDIPLFDEDSYSDFHAIDWSEVIRLPWTAGQCGDSDSPCLP